MKYGSVVIAALVLCGMGAAAEAAPIVFFGEDLAPADTVPVGGNAETARNAFLSNLTGVGTEDFEGQAPGSIGAGINLSFPGSSGAITATVSGGGPGDIEVGLNAGRFPTSGNQFLETNSGQNFNIFFDAPISAFGFYGTDIGDFGGQVILNLTGGGTETLNIGNNTNAPDGSLLFFGFIDPTQTFTNIAFTNTGIDDVFGFDDMTIGDPDQVRVVPEPSTFALFGLGLAAIGGLSRRRRKQVQVETTEA